MKLTRRTAWLITAIAFAYMIGLGLLTVATVGPSQTIAIHFSPTLEPNYGLPAPLAIAILPLMALAIVKWLVWPTSEGRIEGASLATFSITLAITSAAQTFICLMAIF